MKYLLLIWIACFTATSVVQAQAAVPVSGTKSARPMSQERALRNDNAQVQSFRIENGSVWVNGNLAKKSELPASLQNLGDEFSFEASMFGVDELEFTLLGRNYLVKNGRIVEMEIPKTEQAPAVSDDHTTGKEQYYSNLREESPSLFTQINREAELYEKYMRLVLDYQAAPPDKQAGVLEEIRVVLGQLFDLSLSNMQMELKNLEYEVQTIKANLEYRKAHRTDIIEDQLKEFKD